jgi:hypothetical protein
VAESRSACIALKRSRRGGGSNVISALRPGPFQAHDNDDLRELGRGENGRPEARDARILAGKLRRRFSIRAYFRISGTTDAQGNILPGPPANALPWLFVSCIKRRGPICQRLVACRGGEVRDWPFASLVSLPTAKKTPRN